MYDYDFIYYFNFILIKKDNNIMVYQIKKFLSKELILLDKVFYIQKNKRSLYSRNDIDLYTLHIT